MSRLWTSTVIEWKKPRTWMPILSKWLRPNLNSKGIRHLQKMNPPELYVDDPEWMRIVGQILCEDVEETVSRLGEALSQGIVRVFHGCRTDDAGPYLREGIRLNQPELLADRLRELVNEVDGLSRYRDDIDRKIAEFDSKERDTGQLYVVLDDRGLIGDAGHYLLYGSEWMQCILGFGAHDALLKWGAPTIVEIDLPLRMASPQMRLELAEWMLHEWTRLKVTGELKTQDIDFTFMLREALPSELIVGHRHPKRVRDPNHLNILRHTDRPDCAACRVAI